MIGGQEYMLAGRETEKESAKQAATELRKSWAKVRVIKLCPVDFMLYVHGGTPTSRIS